MALAASDIAATTGIIPAIEGVVDRLAGSRMASAVAILIVALACFLPGINTIPPIDRDEARYAMAAGDLSSPDDDLVPAIGSDVALARPMGIVWLQGAVAQAFTDTVSAPIWVYRLPSLIGGIAAALLTWWMALAFGRPRAALIAGVVIAANLILAGEARLARPDAVLLALIVLAEGALARLWLASGGGGGRGNSGLAALFWLAAGLGVLVKGLVAPLVLALTVLVLVVDRRGVAWLRCLRPAWGVPLFVILAAPWLIATVFVGVDMAADTELLAATGRIVSRAPPGTYALLFFVLFWPASSFFLLAIPWILDRLARSAVLFGLAWAAPFWLAAELYPDKLPQYVLPALPALALLTGTALDRGHVAVTGWISGFYSLATPFFAVLVLIGTPIFIVAIGGTFPLSAAPAYLLGAAAAVLGWYWLKVGAALPGFVASVGAAILVYLGLYGFVVPGADRVHLSGRVLAEVEAGAPCPRPLVVSTGYAEPSLRFLQPDVRFADAAGAADFLNQPGCRIAVVENRQISTFRQRAEDLGVEVETFARISGIDLGNNRRVVLRLFAVREGEP